MATDKFDLKTIEYSCQGWDTILSTDMEQLDDVIQSRILATLGETVAVSDALYLHTDGKYYKAQADGTQQPAMGLALETGILDDSIRIQRIGPITDATWTWSVIGAPVFLSDSVAGELTETQPSSDAQAVGIVLSATSIDLNIDLRTTVSGVDITNHSELNELDYASAGHTGFSPDTHTHDDRYYTETELNAGQLDNRYYTESEVDTISGAINSDIPTTLLDLSDTPAAYDDGKYLKSTTSGIVFDDIIIKADDDSLWKITVTSSGILSTTAA